MLVLVLMTVLLIGVAVHHRRSQTLTIAAERVDPASIDLRPLRDPIADLSWDGPL
jgi:hypothetical protein